MCVHMECITKKFNSKVIIPLSTHKMQQFGWGSFCVTVRETFPQNLQALDFNISDQPFAMIIHGHRVKYFPKINYVTLRASCAMAR